MKELERIRKEAREKRDPASCFALLKAMIRANIKVTRECVPIGWGTGTTIAMCSECKHDFHRVIIASNDLEFIWMRGCSRCSFHQVIGYDPERI